MFIRKNPVRIFFTPDYIVISFKVVAFPKRVISPNEFLGKKCRRFRRHKWSKDYSKFQSKCGNGWFTFWNANEPMYSTDTGHLDWPFNGILISHTRILTLIQLWIIPNMFPTITNLTLVWKKPDAILRPCFSLVYSIS